MLINCWDHQCGKIYQKIIAQILAVGIGNDVHNRILVSARDTRLNKRKDSTCVRPARLKLNFAFHDLGAQRPCGRVVGKVCLFILTDRISTEDEN